MLIRTLINNRLAAIVMADARLAAIVTADDRLAGGPCPSALPHCATVQDDSSCEMSHHAALAATIWASDRLAGGLCGSNHRTICNLQNESSRSAGSDHLGERQAGRRALWLQPPHEGCCMGHWAGCRPLVRRSSPDLSELLVYSHDALGWQRGCRLYLLRFLWARVT